MKLTIQSNLMLSPRLHEASNEQPNRLIGKLTPLEPWRRATAQATEPELNNRYRRCVDAFLIPAAHQEKPIKIDMQTLQLATSNAKTQAWAVYAIHFDGQCAWYQVWCDHAQRLYWVQDNGSMSYEALACTIMNELMMLIPKRALNNCMNTENALRLTIFDATVALSGNTWFFAKSTD